jgi:hypothetical protein
VKQPLPLIAERLAEASKLVVEAHRATDLRKAATRLSRAAAIAEDVGLRLHEHAIAQRRLAAVDEALKAHRAGLDHAPIRERAQRTK